MTQQDEKEFLAYWDAVVSQIEHNAIVKEGLFPLLKRFSWEKENIYNIPTFKEAQILYPCWLNEMVRIREKKINNL